MLTQNRRNWFPPSPIGNSFQPPRRKRQARPAREFIDIDYLQNFELVADQFADFGLSFDDAIAISPSNGRFLAHSHRRSIMATSQGKMLKVGLAPTVQQVHLWLVGSQEVAISTLNGNGEIIFKTQTGSLPAQSDDAYREQSTIIDTPGANWLRLSSRAPFIVTQLAVRQNRRSQLA